MQRQRAMKHVCWMWLAFKLKEKTSSAFFNRVSKNPAFKAIRGTKTCGPPLAANLKNGQRCARCLLAYQHEERSRWGVTIAVRVITSLNLDIEVAAVCTRRTADVASQNRYETVLEEMDEFFLKHLPIKWTQYKRIHVAGGGCLIIKFHRTTGFQAVIRLRISRLQSRSANLAAETFRLLTNNVNEWEESLLLIHWHH